MFAFRGHRQASCFWLSPSAAAISSAVVSVGDNLTLRANTIRAFCVPAVFNCSSFLFSGVSAVTVRLPDDAVRPSVTLTSAAVVAACDDVIVDLTQPLGSGGRAWSDLTWSAVLVKATSSNSSSARSVQNYLNTNYPDISSQVRVTIPNRFLPAIFKEYSFEISLLQLEISLYLRNFLGQHSVSKVRVQVRVTQEFLPKLLIFQQSVSSQPDLATFSSQLVASSACASAPSAEGSPDLVYQWKVFADGGVRYVSGLRSLSNDPGRFSFPLAALPTAPAPAPAPSSSPYSSSYTVECSVTVRGSIVATSGSLYVDPGLPAAVAAIRGPALQSFRSSQFVSLDASPSRQYPAGGLGGSLTYHWSCTVASPQDVGSTCPNFVITEGPVITYPPATFPAGRLYRINVTVR